MASERKHLAKDQGGEEQVRDAYPIQSLRDHATEMEAAVLICMAEATPRAVHKLRTVSRRIEAHLALLERMKHLPSYSGKAAKVMRQLRKVRRYAGVVRDLDVQQVLLEEHLPEDSVAAKQERNELQKVRRKLRKKAALELQEMLTRRQKKISRRLEKLLFALEPAESIKLSSADLLRLAETEFNGTHALIFRNPSDEHLHGIRKAAKMARYQAELAGSTEAQLAAGRFKAMQEAGGHWHDWLQLATQAGEELGEDHTTTNQFAQLCERRLNDFRKLIKTSREAA